MCSKRKELWRIFSCSASADFCADLSLFSAVLCILDHLNKTFDWKTDLLLSIEINPGEYFLILLDAAAFKIDLTDYE